MAMKLPSNIWIQRQQCPCGDWKCYIRYESEDQASVSALIVKSETVPSQLSSESVFTPYVGQIFKSDVDAFEYYSNFARKNGFSIRKARSTESQNLGVYRRDFVCYRSGYNQPRKKVNVEHPRERKSVRCGCDAKLYLTKEIVDGVSQWYVSQFSNVHNHELLEDDLVRLLPAYRKIPEADQERILLLSKAGFPVNRILKVLELEKGVQPGQLPFIEKDVRNFIRTCKKTVEENDALLNEKRENELLELLEICKDMAERDSEFVFDYTRDENGKVENISWAYGDPIRAYSVFGDVVSFDTSYRSITYGLLLGVWFSMNNHGKPIILSCVLLQEENSHSFSWALQKFVQFMRGKHPQTIVTDIDSGLRDAISKELPNTKHVVCIWHILSKLSSWFSLPLGLQYANFKVQFDMLWHLENIADFEHQWDLLVAQFGLASDKHIALLYLYRASWSFSFIRGSFLARTLTDDFFQSLEAFLKRILSAQTCLQIFFEQVSNAANSGIQAKEEMGNGSYLLQHYEKMDVERLVSWTQDDKQVHCSCKEFEHSGILCRHSIRVLVMKNYFKLPDKYLLLRWRLQNSLGTIYNAHSQGRSEACAQAFHSLAATLLTESLISHERFNYVHRELSGLLEHVRTMPVVDEFSMNMMTVNEVNDP
ncbi:putative protein FAR1-RELATED SEQUENCE 10 isoform X2 [Benincasa hispida]|uniref:putative protein FAR1-RELATED SEQUENCE 10 isoform X2 n=1 Tax=Benincasa hispida TaxID=102211 RepID=UPI0019026FE2|nr:putative protein FAR1-RELATED SEQUENCE 10 isoform X2 [Benincasa hispida]